MASRLFVGNLPYEATEAELTAHFAQAGPVSQVFIPLDRDTGKPRGFAFVEFEDPGHAKAAIERFHQKPFKDRPLVVNEARPSEARASGPGSRPSAPRGPGRAPSPPRTFGSAPPGKDRFQDAPPRRSSSSKPKRKGGKRSFWEDGPKKEPIPEKRRGQIFADYDELDEEEDLELDEDFDDFSKGLPEDSDDG